MAKYDVTPELGEIIKTVRIQNHVSAKSIAEHIGKSQSYVSKLEKGAIKTIKEEELTSIFRYILGSQKNFQEFLDSALGTIFETLELRYSDEEIDEQIWFDNYDTVLRQIPLPNELINSINDRMRSIGLSVETLCARINANEGIAPEVAQLEKYPFNVWCPYVVDQKIKYSFIKMQVTVSEVTSILEGRISTSNYVTLLAIVYYLTKIEKCGERVNISESEESSIKNCAKEYLNYYRFFSIAEKNKLRRQAHSKAEQDALLSSFDQENNNLINSVLTAFKLYSEIDITFVNRSLKAFVSNLKWDPGYMMRLLSIPFSELEISSFTVKKQMLSEIEAVANRFGDLPSEQKVLETYD